MDQALAVRNATVSMAYREGVFHHGYYRDGDESWVTGDFDTPKPHSAVMPPAAAPPISPGGPAPYDADAT